MFRLPVHCYLAVYQKVPMSSSVYTDLGEVLPNCLEKVQVNIEPLVFVDNDSLFLTLPAVTLPCCQVESNVLVCFDPGTPCQINKVLSHPTLPITITAQEDRHIKFFDNNSGKLIHSMVAHLDAVTSLAVDPNGLYLMSGSKYLLTSRSSCYFQHNCFLFIHYIIDRCPQLILQSSLYQFGNYSPKYCNLSLFFTK